MIYTDDRNAINNSEPGWLSPSGEFYSIRRFILGMDWPHREWAAKKLPDSEDPEKDLESRGWWKCQIAMDERTMQWVGSVSATSEQRAHITRWAKAWAVRVRNEDFVYSRSTTEEKSDTQPHAASVCARVIAEDREATSLDGSCASAARVEDRRQRSKEQAVYIDTLPVAATIQVPVHVSEVDNRDLVDSKAIRKTHSFAPLSADAGDEMSVQADFALGFHVTRHKGGRTYRAHISLERLARAVDSAMQICDAGTLPMATTRFGSADV